MYLYEHQDKELRALTYLFHFIDATLNKKVATKHFTLGEVQFLQVTYLVACFCLPYKCFRFVLP